MRIGIKIVMLDSGRPLNCFDVFRPMAQRQFVWRGRARSINFEAIALQPLGHFDQCLDALRAFRMMPAGKMLQVSAIGDEGGLVHRLTPWGASMIIVNGWA